MSKRFNIIPWLITVGVAWSIGCVYNVYYGGELSWLLRMYRQKSAYAAKIEGPRRILIAAGSGAYYSVNAEQLQKELGIPAFNFGLQGDLGLNVICPIILDQVRPGDIVLLIPEYLMLMDEDGLGDGEGLYGSAPFGVAIGQPGLGGVPPKKLVEDIWLMGIPTLRALAKSTVDVFEKGRMTGYLSDPITEQGDPTKVKERTGKWWIMKFNKSVSPHSIERIAQFRQELKAKGADLVLSLPWVYADASDARTVKSIETTARKLAKAAPTVYDKNTLNIKTDPTLFADTHYHLLPESRIIRTKELAAQLKPVLEEQTLKDEQ